MRKRVNAGALCLTGAASYALTGEKDYASSASVRAFDGARYVSPALGRAVLNDDAGACRPSMAMIGMRRRCSWPSRVSCASERKLFFFQRKEGVGLGKGARACG